MLRWPYKYRLTEGRKIPVKYVTGLLRKRDIFLENIYIFLAPLPASGVVKGETRDERITVSLTSFPARINQAYYAIKSLMLQKHKPDRIVLWLSALQFPDKKLPEKFKKLIERGLEVRFVDEDLRSHKKYYYSLQEQQPGEMVITYDDDLIYEPESIAKLIRTHERNPECVVCNRGWTIKGNTDEGVKPYSEWTLISDEGVETPSHKILASTGAGCLYPYGVMPRELFDKASIKELAPTADDLWLKFNELNHGIKVVKTDKRWGVLCDVYGSQKFSLNHVNCDECENDRVIKRLAEKFPNALKNLWK